MSNEEAIEILEEFKVIDDWTIVHLPEMEDAVDVAIEALRQGTGKLNNPDDSLLTADAEACKEQKSKLDLISRQDAIDVFKKATDDVGILDGEDVKMILSNLPSAEPNTKCIAQSISADSTMIGRIKNEHID